jgi:hypothetical protein
MEIVGYGFIIGCILGLALYFWDEHRKFTIMAIMPVELLDGVLH